MNTLILFACVCFLVLPDVVWSKVFYDWHSKYHVGHVQSGSLTSDHNGGRCVKMEYPPFTLFHDELVYHALTHSDVGSAIFPYYLTTLVSGIPQQSRSEVGTTTITGGDSKTDNKICICTHKKEPGRLEGGDDYSRINWLTWNGDLAPNQMTENMFLEFIDVDFHGKREACRDVKLRKLEVSDTFVFGAGLCGNFEHTGNIAVWTRRIVGSENSGKEMEVCVALDEPPTVGPVCVYGVGIKSELKKDVVEDAGLIQTDSIITDFTKRCAEVHFKQQYDIAPVVFVSPSYRTSCNEHDPGLIAWVEYSNEIGFKACVSQFEPHVDKIGDRASDSLLLNYVVIPRDDTVLKKNPEPMRNAISVEFRTKNTNGEGILGIEKDHLSAKLGAFISSILNVKNMSNFIDSFYQTKNSIVLNIVVQHEGMGLTGTRLTQTANRFERMCRVLYLMYENRNESEEELINVLKNSTIEFDNDKELRYFYKIGQYAFHLVPYEQYKGGYGDAITQLIMVTDADSLKVTAHQECIVGFTSEVCSVPTCIPGVYNGTKTIRREILSQNTKKDTLCPKDLTSVVPCNQSPCELNGWKAPDFSEGNASNVKSPAQVAANGVNTTHSEIATEVLKNKTTKGNPKISATSATGTVEEASPEYIVTDITALVLSALVGITVLCSCCSCAVCLLTVRRGRKNMAFSAI